MLQKWSRGGARRPQPTPQPREALRRRPLEVPLSAVVRPLPGRLRRAAGENALPALRLLKTCLGERGAAVWRRGTHAEWAGSGEEAGGRARTAGTGALSPGWEASVSVCCCRGARLPAGAGPHARAAGSGENFVKARQLGGCLSASNAQLRKRTVAPSHPGELGGCSACPAPPHGAVRCRGTASLAN